MVVKDYNFLRDFAGIKMLLNYGGMFELVVSLSLCRKAHDFSFVI